MPTFDHAFDWVRRNVDDGPLPTAVLGIATADGVVAIDAFGAASADDHYPLFSVTKPIVGLAALRLVEQGRLLPTTPLTRAVPEFGAGRDDDVQLRHLVSHTSGIVEPPLDTPDGLRPSLLAPGRDFAAGTMSRYSSIAFEGVAALIEHASGAPWEESVLAVGESVGATGLTFDADAGRHEVVDAAEQGLDYARFAELRHPGAGLLGRAEDLLAIGSALLGGGGPLVSPVGVERCCGRSPPACRSSSRTPRAAGRTGDSRGTCATPRPDCSRATPTGTAAGRAAEFWITPSRGVCFVLLTNIGGGFGRFGVDADELHNAIAAAAR